MLDFWTVFLICWLSGVAFLVWVIRRQTEDVRKRLPPQAPPPPLSAEEILRQRYVRGEIETGEYERYLDVLVRTAPYSPERNGLAAGRGSDRTGP
jgi:uncharacterized membrane protein